MASKMSFEEMYNSVVYDIMVDGQKNYEKSEWEIICADDVDVQSSFRCSAKEDKVPVSLKGLMSSDVTKVCKIMNLNLKRKILSFPVKA